MKKFLAVLLMLSMVFAFVACGKNGDSKDSDRDSGKISDTVKDSDKDSDEDISVDDNNGWTSIGKGDSINDCEYFVNNVIKDNDPDYFPDEGNTYYLVDLSITNNSDEDVELSSIMMFTLYDSEDNSYDISLTGLGLLSEYGDMPSADGTVAPGEEFRCGVAFEVPEDAEGFVLEISDFSDTIEIELD